VLAVWYLISAAIAHDLAGAVPAMVPPERDGNDKS